MARVYITQRVNEEEVSNEVVLKFIPRTNEKIFFQGKELIVTGVYHEISTFDQFIFIETEEIKE